MSELSVRYEFDESFFDPKLRRDDFGRLWVSARTDRFCGRGWCWVQWQEVREFGEMLACYPIREDAPLVGEWGYNQLQGDDLLLRIEIAPANRRGDLVVRFEIADEDEPRDRVRGSFLTNYPDVEAFRCGLAKLMNNEAEEATLTGR